MSHTDRIGQLVHEHHHHRMLADATQRQLRHGRQFCDLVMLTAVASRQSRPGGAP
jgi:hypothetical protein